MFKVERYLRDFLAGLDRQGDALGEVEVLFVDDGSPDQSAAIAQTWLDENTVNGRVIRQENRGLSGARNLGMSQAEGEWVSFPDPDDVLSPKYLTEILSVMDHASPSVSAIAANIIYLDDETGKTRAEHPLREVFAHGPRVISLDDEPQAVKLQAASTFLRRSLIESAGLTFDHRVRPNFEDGAFLIGYHASVDAPALAVVPAAHYLYRQRSDASSLVASSWTNPLKYTDLPRYGWLEPLTQLFASRGFVPAWAQTMVFYDMHWYFRYDAWIHTPTRSVRPEVRAEFMRIVREVLMFIDPATILGYSLTDLQYQTRVGLLAWAGRLPSPSVVERWRTDRYHDLTQLKYYFAGERPTEVITRHGRVTSPAFAKDRSIEMFGETVMHERIIWIRDHHDLQFTLDGVHAPIRARQSFRPAWPKHGPAEGTAGAPGLSAPAKLRRTASTTATRALNGTTSQALVRSRKFVSRALAKTSIWQARHRPWNTKYRHAWLFMDRDTQAHDNAEHLYRWVKRNRPEVNAWFVLRRSSRDWNRLEAEGFRLIDFGTHEHTLALKNAEHLISSHVDHYVVQPLSKARYGSNNWAYSFLQHGVTKDDISRWLNSKPISLIVTAAPAEQRGFVADGTPYTFTAKQAPLTGFPRHDELLSKSRAVTAKNMILMMPTWREYLMSKGTQRGNHREIISGFADSEYVRSWGALLSSPELNEYAAANGLRVAFMAHPNLEKHIGAFDLPEGVDVLTYGSTDVQEAIANASVLVTDYSSLAFEAAYITTPVVYFQFDRDDFFRLHPHRPGYFNYAEHGFGPVTTTAREATAATIDQIEGSSSEARTYLTRAQEFFIDRDGRNCERTFEAIKSLRTPTN